MGFLDKAKAAADQAAERVQQGVEDVQTKRDLTQVYGDLGRTAYSLAQRGEISHAELTPLVQRITELESSAGAGAPATGAPEAGTPSPVQGTPPPAPGTPPPAPGTPPPAPGEAAAAGTAAAAGAESAGGAATDPGPATGA